MRLRISWGGTEPSRWFGRMRLDQGAVAHLQLLGPAPDGAGSFWIADGALHVDTLSAQRQHAVEVVVPTGQSARLLVELSSDATQTRPPTSVPIADALKHPYVVRLDDRGNTLKVELVPPEALRVAPDREQLIFAPGESFAGELTAALADAVPGTTLDIRTTLSPARRGETLWSSDQRLEVPVNGQPRLRLDVPLPDAEGVYQVRIAALRPSGFRERFFPGTPTPLAERRIDVVVLDPQRSSAAQSPKWETVLEIDPTSPRWWDRLPSWTQLRRIPGLNRGPLGSLRAGSVESPLGRFIELPPTASEMDPHWQAYSLPLEAAGTPHLLEIDYPAADEQHFGISIVEPNAAGVVDGIGRDSGVYVEGLGRGDAKGRQTHRLVFWPRTHAPLLLVTNAHPTAPAHFGQIRVRKLSTGRLAAEQPDPAEADRLVAAYFARPLVPESFGASEALDPALESQAATSRSVDDWQTFYESATRLADYLRYSGYNSAVVNVLANGSSIYPSAKLLPTPLYDSGRAAANGSQRDALELLMRVFDREGLSFVPALQLATPLPELEQLRRGSDPQESGLEWIGPEGRTWLDVYGTRDGLAPYYNLLDPRVQQAVLNVCRELVERYGHHSSMAGLAVQLSARGYAQLPPLEWGLDDATMGRFEQQTGIRLATTGPGRFAARHALVSGKHAAAWRSWRAARLAAFYEQLAQTVRGDGAKRRLILTLEESFAHAPLAARIRPELVSENRVEPALVDAGIDRQSLEKIPGVVLCPARFVEPMQPLSDRAADLEMNQGTAGWRRGAAPASTAAALLYHRHEQRALRSFAAESPLTVAGEMTLRTQSLPSGPVARQPYVLALLDNDPAVLLDGGERLPIGHEDTLRQVRTIVRQLPTSAKITEHAGQPVFVRSYSEPHRTTLLVVNASPWHTEAEVTLDVSRPTTLEPLPAAGAAPPRPLAAGKQPWSLSMEPYAIEAVRIDGPGATVRNVRADISATGKAELATSIADLSNRDFTAPRTYTALANPSFEPFSGAGAIPRWRLTGDGATAELDATTPQHGKTCAYLKSGARGAMLESDEFATPPTGQLAMTIFARAHSIEPSTELRLVFEASDGAELYRRSFVVGGAQAQTQRLESQWRPYAIYVNDLPLDSQGRMRVRFELSGPGEIWFDNVQLYELLFPLKWYPQSQAEIKQFFILIHAAQRAVEAGRIADSVRLLEGYWPRFIATYTPIIQLPVAAERAPQAEQQSAAPTDEVQEPAPSISEHIKRLVPFWR